MSDAADRIVVWHPGHVERAERARATGVEGRVVWFTGLSGSGKSTVAVEVERALVGSGRAAYLLDGDNLRHGLNVDLGFSAADRDENVRRVGEIEICAIDLRDHLFPPAAVPQFEPRTGADDHHLLLQTCVLTQRLREHHTPLTVNLQVER